MSENHSVAAGIFRNVSTSQESMALVMTNLRGLILELQGDDLWDILWDAMCGGSLSLRVFGDVQIRKVQSITSCGSSGSGTVRLATATPTLRSGRIGRRHMLRGGSLTSI